MKRQTRLRELTSQTWRTIGARQWSSEIDTVTAAIEAIPLPEVEDDDPLTLPSLARFEAIAEWSRSTPDGQRRSRLIEHRDKLRRWAEYAETMRKRRDAFASSPHVHPTAHTFDSWIFGSDEHAKERAAVWAWCTRWAVEQSKRRDRTRNVVLASHRKGSGKSHLAAAMAYECCLAGQWVAVWPVNEMFRAVKATFDNRSKTTADDFIDGWQRCDVLVIDDMGTHRGTAWELGEILWPIVDARCKHDRATIITTNHAPVDEAGWVAMLGGDQAETPGHIERMVSRLREDARLLPMQWADWRQRKTENGR